MRPTRRKRNEKGTVAHGVGGDGTLIERGGGAGDAMKQGTGVPRCVKHPPRNTSVILATRFLGFWF